MPSAPIIGNRGCQIGAFKVFIQRYAENLRRACCNINPAGKIAVNLDGIRQRRCRNIGAAEGFGETERIIHQNRRSIRDDHFLKRAPEHQLYAELDACIGKFIRAEQLLRQCAEARNRPLHNLREKGNKQRQLAKVPLRLLLFSVNINQISHGLEGIERNAQGQKKPKNGQLRPNADFCKQQI